ncbi:conserved Plasmodium protein, unknown function [Plasmodium berghei]|uniref:Uncharacterized protein n=2 Tax=Plasmodium berghei TaxID=5821 RepID=A0A509AMA1_PLABA|nr:conserved Plasmodium protein, unknown function [Plasmodium berghei ANKA]CXI66713.1 conserved Plasmodium protein, unknown function [Plasmodium berghei]SCM24060.1 conserved Plasmodium protein, unknown function [Plasmodium berghei]SCN26906.1 conserved Plasmodium protein, unknown function [Plasmodium berghei]SCO61329.1 conserved Plasmodium protein, unknown function [Plasmodium berghei]SCO63327.1 conserved Plasmodium protein, unknown function [Plasmodium berghei]|eukprot:XP_034422522.1 conserved Plasmodium protein, unknown function [Plasmodium berghei ANKA]
MDNNIKELIKREKERRKLLRDQKKKSEQNPEKDQNDFSLKIKNNNEENEEYEINSNIQEYKDKNVVNVIKNKDNIILKKNSSNSSLKKVHFEEPETPLNRINKDNNLKNAFMDYFDEDDEENDIPDKSCFPTTTKLKVNSRNDDKDAPKNFFDISVSTNIENSSFVKTSGNTQVQGIEKSLNGELSNNDETPNTSYNDTHKDPTNDERIYINDKYCLGYLLPSIEKEENVEVIETYEIIDQPADKINIEWGEDFRKKIQKKRKGISIYEDYENEHDEGNELNVKNYQNKQIESEEKNEENGNRLMKLFNNEIYDSKHFKMLDTAYYEELEYLHKLLIEKKKNILGDLHEEENDQNEDNDNAILDELDEFHKKNNNDTYENFNIDEIYELLNIKKKSQYTYGNIGTNIQNNNNDKKLHNNTNKKNNIPKGFFDDKEKDILVRENISLSKINQKIEEIKKRKKKILKEYKNTENLFEEKKNTYIDYLYGDKFDNKENILNEIKTQTNNLYYNKKNEFKIKDEKKKKKKYANNKDDELYDFENDLFDWRTKNIFSSRNSQKN